MIYIVDWYTYILHTINFFRFNYLWWLIVHSIHYFYRSGSLVGYLVRRWNNQNFATFLNKNITDKKRVNKRWVRFKIFVDLLVLIFLENIHVIVIIIYEFNLSDIIHLFPFAHFILEMRQFYIFNRIFILEKINQRKFHWKSSVKNVQKIVVSAFLLFSLNVFYLIRDNNVIIVAVSIPSLIVIIIWFL